jgi:hypothetical protein
MDRRCAAWLSGKASTSSRAGRDLGVDRGERVRIVAAQATVGRVRRPPGRGRLERPVARRPRLGGGLIRQRLARGVIAALRALAGHRQAQRGEQPGRRVVQPGALGLEQRERLLRPLRPDRQEPGQPHRHLDALGRCVRRQQSQEPAQHLARVTRPSCRDQR